MQSVLDELGAESGCTTVNLQGEFIVARPEAIYLYSTDGRGPCFVFEGKSSVKSTSEFRADPHIQNWLKSIKELAR